MPNALRRPAPLAHPAIERNGYQLCTTDQFLERASDALIARYRRDCIGRGGFIIWDPNDDEGGFMVAAHTVAALNAEFLQHFGPDLA